jgi:hypothetical protein
MIVIREQSEEFRTDRPYLRTFRNVAAKVLGIYGFGGVLFKESNVRAERVFTSALHSGDDRVVCFELASDGQLQSPRAPLRLYRELTLGTKAKDGLTEMKNLNEIATSAPCRHP